MTNGLTGIRIITAVANTSPYNLAPIQGVQLADGSWTGAGGSPNLLYAETPGFAGNTGVALHTAMSTVTGYSAVVTLSGPLKSVITVTYSFNRPRYYYSSTTITPAGTGQFTQTITMYAGSKSILINDWSDMQFAYYVPLISAVTPDTMRWKGHSGPNSVQ